MSGKYPIEALLRPPVEYLSAAICTGAASISLIAPSTLMMTPSVSYGSAVLLGSLATYRFLQGRKITRYQANMRRLPVYSVTSSEIQVSNKKLYLGKGFRWTQTHTQRLRDAQKPEYSKYIDQSQSYYWARRKELQWENGFLSHFAKLLGSDSRLNPVRPLPPVGGKPILHAVEPDEEDVALSLGERVGHTLVLGTTRVGKTRLAELLVTQDIRRGNNTVIFIDPKGDADVLCRMYAEAKRAGREDEFYIFHLGYPEISARYNAIGSFDRITEVATRTAGQLASSGNSAAFKEFGWRFVNIIARALVDLGKRPDFNLLLQHVTNIEPLFVEYCEHWLHREGQKDWHQHVDQIESRLTPQNIPINMKGRDHRVIALETYLSRLNTSNPIVNGLRSAVKYDKTYFDKITASLLPFLEKITSGKVSELIAPDYFDINDERPLFDWMQVIRKKGIVYIGLDALSDTDVATAVGNTVFADIVSVAGHIYKHGTERGLAERNPEAMPKICLHGDEFSDLIGDEFIPMVNKGGGSGLQITAYTQTLSDIAARVGELSKAGQVQGNFNNLIMLRVREQKTAEYLTEQLPQVDITQLTNISGSTDSSTVDNDIDFTSNVQDRSTTLRVPMIEPSDVIQLPKGQAFALLEGGHLWKIRIPLAKPDKTDDMPQNVQMLTEAMRRAYRTGEGWWVSSSSAPTFSAGGFVAVSENEEREEAV
ncbi:type IV conjugative transfer system coupling protein TraD [Endozoicomonas sp. ALC066]|uniref:type IV conjugative transfer system coupling protein TraD n=1 Tax=Endozoicomonas sp. ALC066 TaxID=3403078 RepID=UPI003BB78368